MYDNASICTQYISPYCISRMLCRLVKKGLINRCIYWDQCKCLILVEFVFLIFLLTTHPAERPGELLLSLCVCRCLLTFSNISSKSTGQIVTKFCMNFPYGIFNNLFWGIFDLAKNMATVSKNRP